MRHGLKKLTVAQRTAKIREEADSAMLRMKTLCGWNEKKEEEEMLEAIDLANRLGYLLIDGTTIPSISSIPIDIGPEPDGFNHIKWLNYDN